MKQLVVLLIGFALGAGALWLYSSREGNAFLWDTAGRIDQGTRPARDVVGDKIGNMNLRPEDIMEELSRGGAVVRRTAQQAGQVIADATADARITTAIKGRLLASKELSALNISVNTTLGVVTLSGLVESREHVSRAMLVAFETDGVREVISTLQVRPPKGL